MHRRGPPGDCQPRRPHAGASARGTVNTPPAFAGPPPDSTSRRCRGRAATPSTVAVKPARGWQQLRVGCIAQRRRFVQDRTPRRRLDETMPAGTRDEPSIAIGDRDAHHRRSHRRAVRLFPHAEQLPAIRAGPDRLAGLLTAVERITPGRTSVTVPSTAWTLGSMTWLGAVLPCRAPQVDSDDLAAL